MQKIFIIGAALALSACSATGTLGQSVSNIPTSPSAIADKTVLDEQIGIGAEQAYKVWRVAIETGVDAKLIKGRTAIELAQWDNQLYSVLGQIRLAYAAGNAASYNAAFARFNTVLGNAQAELKGATHVH